VARSSVATAPKRSSALRTDQGPGTPGPQGQPQPFEPTQLPFTRQSVRTLQQASGNLAVSRLLTERSPQARSIRRTSQVPQLVKADATDRGATLNALTVDELCDTTFDPQFAKIAPAILGELGSLSDADRRKVRLAITAGTTPGAWGEPFYYELGLMENGPRDDLWNALQKKRPALASVTARMEVMFQAVAGFIRANDFEGAFGVMAKYNMNDILNMLSLVQAANLLATLDAQWTEAKGIDVPRMKAAVRAIQLIPLARYFNVESTGAGDLLAKLAARSTTLAGMEVEQTTLTGEITRLETELGAAAGDAERVRQLSEQLAENKAHERRLDDQIAFLRSNQVAVDELTAVLPTLQAYDQQMIVERLGQRPEAAFFSTLGDARIASEGQFALSAGTFTALGKRITDGLNAGLWAAMTPAERGQMDARIAALFDALGASNVNQPEVSYARVDVAARALKLEVSRVAQAKGVPVPQQITAALAQVMKSPPPGKAFEMGMQVYKPLWDKWIESKAFPDVADAANAYKCCYLRMADQWACEPTTRKLPGLFDAQSPGRAKDPKFAFGRTKLATGTKVTRGPVPDGRGGTRQAVVDEQVIYRSDLAAWVERMRLAIDNGWFIHVRVLSGVAMDYTAQPENAEHSLLVVGYRGNEFMCSDADPGGEGREHLKVGATSLFYSAGSLATAIGPAREVDLRGFQKSDRHHRYQAWSVETI